MSNIVNLDVITRLDVPAERVIEGVKEANLETIVVLGYDQEGMEFFSSNKADGGTVLWLLERLKMQLLEVGDAE